MTLLTAACAETETAPATGSAAPPQAPVEGQVPERPAPPARAALPPAPPPAPAPPPMPPEKLLGMEEAAVSALLGRPAFRRTDAAAELWRYRAGGCILDLFLYPPRRSPAGPLAVRHVEARGRNGAEAPAGRCLEAVLKARAGGGAT